MKKRLLALACVLAILAGMLVVPASAADEHVTDTEPYQVGYSKKDINPWVALDLGNGETIGIPAKYTDANGNLQDYTDAANIITTTIHKPADLGKATVGTQNASLVAVPLAGYGNAESNPRNTACLTDDNGDGYVSYGDGVYITCTSVTDDYGKTMLFLTFDVGSVSATLVSEIRTAIISRLGADVVKSADIMVSVNHSHSGPSLSDCRSKAAGTAYRAYYDYVLNQAAAAAEEAFDGKSDATMSRGSIEASAVMEDLGYPADTKLNFVRQYKTKHTLEKQRILGSWEGSWQLVAEDVSLVRTSHTGGTFSKTVTLSDGKIYKYRSTFELVDHVSEVDETLHVLKFEREEGNPIVMVNWRAHSTITGNADWHNISGDYANALRYRLENNSKFDTDGQDYCVAYWQGASGNVNTASSLEDDKFENFWKNDYATDDTAKLNPSNGEVTEVKVPSKDTTNAFYKAYYGNKAYFEANDSADQYDDSIFYNAKYGYLLAKVALQCMAGPMTECETGRIYSRVTNMKLQPQQFTKGEYLAAVEWQENGSSGSADTFPYLYDADLVGNDGKTERYVLNSRFHASKILSRYPYQFENNDVENGTPLAIEDQSPVDLDVTTIKLGSQVALLVLSGEPSDRYSLEATLETVNQYNDWDNLVDEDTYGTPFVLGYSNAATSYLDNALAHSYNSLAEDHPYYGFYGAGSYGSNSGSMAKGSGEAIIKQFAKELAIIENDYRIAQCEACGKKVEWTPITKLQAAQDFESGHYYLTEDITVKDEISRKLVGSTSHTETVCLDLNGHTMTRNGFFCRIYGNSKLNVMDTVGTGGITAHSIDSDHIIGGVFVLENSSTMNLYGGKLEFVQGETIGESGIAKGGVFSLSGTLNMYGGTVQGGDLVLSSSPNIGTTNGNGGAIFVYSAGTLNAYGGEILSGTVPPEGDGGPCVYVAGNGAVNISGDAEIEELYFQNNNGRFTVSGNYTGKTALNFMSGKITADKTDIGTVKGTYTANNITCQIDGTEYAVEAGGVQWNDKQGMPVGDLMLFKTDSVAAVIDKDTYPDVVSAINAYNDDSKYIKLLKDVENLTVNKNVYLDLNGKNITGDITATNGGKLYCLDTETDDYDIEPNEQGGYTGYGKVTNFDPAVVAAVAADDLCAEDGYLMFEETDGTSFHRVNLRLTAMTLRAEPFEDDHSPSVYYKSAFGGDQMVADNVASFGVAISIKEEPNEDNMGDSNLYSEFEEFQPGENGKDTTSTLLYGIMKETNARQTNDSNSTRPIHGRAYIKLNSGAYMFGTGYCQSLVEQTETIDAMWNGLNKTQKQSLLTMYETYEDVMKPWSIPNIKAEYNKEEDETLKVLVVGNSHGKDAMNLLYEVFKKEAPNQKVVLGGLHRDGCRMDQHDTYMTKGSARYIYYKNGNYEGANKDGSWQTFGTGDAGVTADVALTDEQWDIVIMQQMNIGAAVDDGTSYDGYDKSDFMNVIRYIKASVEPDPVLLWHMVWTNPDEPRYFDPNEDVAYNGTNSEGVAYADDWLNTHKTYFPGNTETGYDQSVMYEKIIACTQKNIIGDETFLSGSYFTDILPSATAVEYAQDELGVTQAQIYSDYTHMSDFGRLMVSYLWYAKLMEVYTGEPVAVETIKVTEIPKVLHRHNSAYPVKNAGGNYTIEPDMQEKILQAVQYTLEHPYTLP